MLSSVRLQKPHEGCVLLHASSFGRQSSHLLPSRRTRCISPVSLTTLHINLLIAKPYVVGQLNDKHYSMIPYRFVRSVREMLDSRRLVQFGC